MSIYREAFFKQESVPYSIIAISQQMSKHNCSESMIETTTTN